VEKRTNGRGTVNNRGNAKRRIGKEFDTNGTSFTFDKQFGLKVAVVTVVVVGGKRTDGGFVPLPETRSCLLCVSCDRTETVDVLHLEDQHLVFHHAIAVV